MKFTELKQQLTRGAVSPVYMPIGNDRYLVTHTKKLLSELADLPELNVNTLPGTAGSYEVLKACSVMPLMSKYRLVIFEGYKTLDPVLIDYFRAPCPDTVLMLLPHPSVSNPTDAVKNFETVAVVDCAHLDRGVLFGWIKKAAGDRIEPDASELLIDYTASDLTRIDTELKKLLEYAGESRPVTREDVRRMVVRDTQYKIYELTQAVTQGKTDDAYEMAESLLREIDPLAVIKSLSNVYHRMLHVRISRVSDDELAKSFGVKPAALWHLRAQAKAFSPLKLRETCEYILDCEHRAKTGGLTSRAALDNILLKVFSLRAV